MEYQGIGLPNHFFAKDDTPITKEEIRVITLSKARLGPEMTIWDIGSGTGSIAIEAARLAPDSQVWAIEKASESCALIKINCSQLKVSGVRTIEGEAPDALLDLPRPHRIIVGGTGGRAREIFELARDKLLPGGIVVVNAVTLDTLQETLKFFDSKWQTEVIQVSVNRLTRLGASHILKANNPVFIISAWGWGNNC